MRIMQATEEDIPDIVEVQQAALKYMSAQFVTDTNLDTYPVEGYMDYWDYVLSAPHKKTFIGVVEDQVVGVCMLSANKKNQSNVDDIYITPKYIGYGYGRALIEKAEAVSMEMGCGHIGLSVATQNRTAHKFYENMGYVLADPQKNILDIDVYLDPDDQVSDMIEYSKVLQPG